MVKRKSEASDTTSVLKSASTKKHKTFDNAGDASIGAEVDFPRGGGTGLTAVETAQAKHEGRNEADRDAKLKRKPSVVRYTQFYSFI